MPPGINLSDFFYLLPEIVLTTGALLLLLADLLVPRDKQSILAGSRSPSWRRRRRHSSRLRMRICRYRGD